MLPWVSVNNIVEENLFWAELFVGDTTSDFIHPFTGSRYPRNLNAMHVC